MRLVVFDTNAWLDLYMIQPVALKEIVTRISEHKDEYWIPEQVYWEFTRHSKEKRETAFKIIENASTNARNANETVILKY